MNEPTSLQPGGLALRAVLVIELPARNGTVGVPSPTQEYGGLLPVQPGTCVRLDIGDARHAFTHDTDRLVGALGAAAEIEVVGTNQRGVASMRNALSASLRFARLRDAG